MARRNFFAAPDYTYQRLWDEELPFKVPPIKYTEEKLGLNDQQQNGQQNQQTPHSYYAMLYSCNDFAKHNSFLLMRTHETQKHEASIKFYLGIDIDPESIKNF